MNSRACNELTLADIVVVGNGALGLFLADELAGRNSQKKIAVVGPRDRNGGASQAAGAMLGCFSEVTNDTLRTDASRARFEIGVGAHEYWDSSLKTLQVFAPNNRPLKVADDTYVILNSSGSQLDSIHLDSIIDALESYDKPWEEVDAEAIRGLNPKPNCRAFRAIRLPEEGAVDARAVLSALESKLQARGVVLVDQSVKQLQCSFGKVNGVQLQDGQLIESDTVVVAAGARSEELIRTADEELDMIPTFAGLGLGIISKRTNGSGFRSVVRTPNRGFACGLHVVPNGNGREYLGATNRIVPHVATGACFEDLSYFTRCAMEQLDENIATHEIEHLLRGNRPITLDGYPLIGSFPVDGLYLMTGTYRDGFHSAPLIAVHMANKMEGLPGVISTLFEPCRNPIESRTRDQSVEDFVQHSIAMWYESSADAPFSTQKLTDLYTEQAIGQYEKLSIEYALSPDVLWYSIRSPAGAERIKDYLDTLQLDEISPLANIFRTGLKNTGYKNKGYENAGVIKP